MVTWEIGGFSLSILVQNTIPNNPIDHLSFQPQPLKNQTRQPHLRSHPLKSPTWRLLTSLQACTQKLTTGTISQQKPDLTPCWITHKLKRVNSWNLNGAPQQKDNLISKMMRSRILYWWTIWNRRKLPRANYLSKMRSYSDRLKKILRVSLMNLNSLDYLTNELAYICKA